LRPPVERVDEFRRVAGKEGGGSRGADSAGVKKAGAKHVWNVLSKINVPKSDS